MSSSLPSIAGRVGPAVIGLRNGSRGGSGVVIAPGVAATLARNVTEERLTVRVGGRDLEARVAGTDPRVDLAILRIDDDAGASPVSWSPAIPVVGSDVIALGDPSGRGLRVTAGAVSATPYGVRGPGGRIIEGVVEHTAPLPRGTGGGPLVDGDGLLVGLNAIRRGEGLIAAWPAAALRGPAERLIAGGGAAPATLGVALAGPRQTARMRAAVGLDRVDGLLVRDVEPGSPAERAGLVRGDVLTAVGDAPLRSADPLFAALDGGGRLRLSVVRGADELQLTAELEVTA